MAEVLLRKSTSSAQAKIPPAVRGLPARRAPIRDLAVALDDRTAGSCSPAKSDVANPRNRGERDGRLT